MAELSLNLVISGRKCADFLLNLGDSLGDRAGLTLSGNGASSMVHFYASKDTEFEPGRKCIHVGSKAK